MIEKEPLGNVNAGDADEPHRASMAVFRQLLANTLVSGVTSSFLWFALTFWVYLETRSVVATGVIGGAFSISSAVLGPFFGTFVDRHRKHTAMMLTTVVSTACFAVATAVFLAVDADDLLRLRSPWFWLLVGFTLLGLGGRPDARHRPVDVRHAARARGRAATAPTGWSAPSPASPSPSPRCSAASSSAGSGWAGRTTRSLALTVAALVHLRTIEHRRARARARRRGRRTSRGTSTCAARSTAIRAVPGLQMLILLAAFNNLLAGVFMALMDAYGLSLVSVETWGLLWGFISLAFIAGGVVVARCGLGSQPACASCSSATSSTGRCARCSRCGRRS